MFDFSFDGILFLLYRSSASCFFSSQHPTASPVHATEITSSRAEPDEQPAYLLSDAAAPLTRLSLVLLRLLQQLHRRL